MFPTEGLRLDGAPGLDAVARFRTDLLQAIAPGKVTRVETSGLTSAGFSLLQTLFAAQVEAQGRKASLIISVPADGALSEALDRFGLCDALPCRPAIENGEWFGLVSSGEAE
jgi:hypothetical protein